MNHEGEFVAVFVAPEKRERYAEFLAKPKRRGQITGRFNHFFDFLPEFSRQVPRGAASELASLLRPLGAPDIAHIIGGRDEIDGRDMPLEQAIDGALADAGGVVISCVPGQLALLIQEFPPGDTFILSAKSCRPVCKGDTEPNRVPVTDWATRPSQPQVPHHPAHGSVTDGSNQTRTLGP